MGYTTKWKVPSSSGRGEYTVSLDDSGNYSCGCPAWTRARRICKHITAVKDGRYKPFWHNGREMDGPDDRTFEEILGTIEPPAPKRKPLFERLRDEARWRFS